MIRYTLNYMASATAIVISLLSLLVAYQSYQLSHRADQRKNENLDMEFGRPKFYFDPDEERSISLDYDIIFYNPSESAVTLKSINISNTRRWTEDSPHISKYYPSGECKYDEAPSFGFDGPELGPSPLAAIRIESRDTYRFDVSCKIFGSPDATDLLAEFLQDNHGGTVNDFMRHIYKKKEIDYAGVRLPAEMNGVATMITGVRHADPELGSLSYFPIFVSATTFSGNTFQNERYIYLGMSKYR